MGIRTRKVKSRMRYKFCPECGTKLIEKVAGDDAGKTAAKQWKNGGIDMICEYGAKAGTPKPPKMRR